MKPVMMLLVLSFTVLGQVSIQLNVGPRNPPPPPAQVVVVPDGYVDDCEYREDMVVVAPGTIGFWVRLQNGHFVLHCRKVWYDRDHGALYYGPWREDYKVIYSPNCARFDDDYVVYHYPKYKGKRFHGDRDRDHQDRDRDHQDWDRDHQDWDRDHHDGDRDDHHDHGHK